MPTTDIVVEKREHDYRAALADTPEVWESGNSDVEAIGKLVISAGRTLGISVQRGGGKWTGKATSKKKIVRTKAS